MDVLTGNAKPERYVIVWDCESDHGFDNRMGKTNEDMINFMQFTVICAIAMPSEMIERSAPVDEIMANSVRYSWWRDVAEQGTNPIVTLLELFDKADLIVGYNCLGFDFPLIRRFYSLTQNVFSPTQRYVNHRSKTLDIMAKVRDATSNYFKLDELLKKNCLKTKSSNGKEAIRMWEEGRREDLRSYCENDVVVTARLALLESMRIGDYIKLKSTAFGIRHYLYVHKEQHKVDEDGFVIIATDYTHTL